MTVHFKYFKSDSSTDSYDGLEPQTKKQKPVEDAERELDINILDDDVLYEIFKFLPFKDLISAGAVCKNWRSIASTRSLWSFAALLYRYPSIDVLQNFSINTRESLGNLLIRLESVFQRISQLPVLNNAGATIVSVTDTSANELLESGKFSNVKRAVSSRIGDQKVTGTWLITNSALEGTGDMTVEEQRAFVESRGCQMAELVPLMALCASPDSAVSLGDEPLTYVRCSNELQLRTGSENVVIGGTTEEGANISAYSGKAKVPHYYAGAMVKIE
ncbi:MAG: F-box protein [Verrucomicrobia bacterium]|nr:F-box protein [Verrucomicrobiota bacterium]